ncbi:MAG: hypothetical protein V2A73_08525, partial [Pseudomonadota bacterium]
RALLRGIREGSVVVLVAAPGFQSWEGTVSVRAGQQSDLDVPLKPDLEKQRDASTREPASRLGQELERNLRATDADKRRRSAPLFRTLAWTSAVATAGGIASFTITGLRVRKLEEDKIARIRQSWANQEEDQRITSVADGCAEAEIDGYAPVRDVCREGKQMATLTNVLIGVSTALAVATGYFAFKGFLASEESPRGEKNGSSSTPRITVTPLLLPSGTGLGTTIQF